MLTKAELAELPPDGGPDYNRLIFEKSPYLLQHARNPVDWYPWGTEAFEKARREDKPLFLSIGYSTCHWCHVMERESFENLEVARLMNGAFVCIKVDREERPDVDNVYMNVAQVMTGRGGWPLTIIMASDKRPFFAGTYIPRESVFGRIGMVQLIPRIQSLWTERRNELLKSADQITSLLRGAVSKERGQELGLDELKAAYQGLAGRFDGNHGGFGDPPKFPTPHNLLFLLRYWRRTGEARALEMVERTLEAMRRGGIFDHVGLGFHRYSTDELWLVPHFEKMLYDQAMLAMAYIEAYQASGRPDFAKTAREIFQYVLDDLASPDGAFYSAEDADSEGEEGKYYLWTTDEIAGVLGPAEGPAFIRAFNAKEEGNFRHETGGPSHGANILHLSKAPSEIAAELGISQAQLEERLEAARLKLLDVRRRRVPPLKDNKILTDWNGLMIAALAKGAQALHNSSYASAAREAADFLLARVLREDGRLLHRFRDGEAAITGFLDDYAFLVWGLIELYEASFEVRYLECAMDLTHEMIDHFWDDAAGGFFYYANDSEELIVRSKEVYDGAVPSGNSVAALNLLRLGRIAGDPALEGKASRTFRIFSQDVYKLAWVYTQMMVALDFAIGPSYEVVVTGESGAADTEKMLKALREIYVPNKVVVFRPAGQLPPIARIAEYTVAQTTIDGKATGYVCRQYTCKAPTTDPAAMAAALGAG